MLVKQLIPHQSTSDFAVISERCSHFLCEAGDEPLLKNLPREYSNVHKVKARKRNISNHFTDVFNLAFEDMSEALCQRAIFAHGISTFDPSIERGLEPFYVFPIDGYQYLYNPEIVSSSTDHKQVFEVLFNEFGFEKGKDIVLEVLKLAYKPNKLQEGISCGAEIILFNIPFYYVVRASLYEYENLLTLIASHR